MPTLSSLCLYHPECQLKSLFRHLTRHCLSNCNKKQEARQLEDPNLELKTEKLPWENLRSEHSGKQMEEHKRRPNQEKQLPTWLDEYEL